MELPKSPGSSGQSMRFQSIEARLAEISPPVHAGLSHTSPVAGPNACEATGGTNMGSSRTVSADETWTKAEVRTSPSARSPFLLYRRGRGFEWCRADDRPRGCGLCEQDQRGGWRSDRCGGHCAGADSLRRSRSSQSMEGMAFQPPSATSTISGASMLRNTVIENPLLVDVTAHPIIVENTLIRRDPSVSREDSSGAGVGGCARFSIRQHHVPNIAPSRVARTIIDGLGSTPGFGTTVTAVLRSTSRSPMKLRRSSSAPGLSIRGGPVSESLSGARQRALARRC